MFGIIDRVWSPLDREGGETKELEGLGKVKLPVYVFGYGSLLFPDGWDGRRMIKRVFWDDVIPCRLHGWKRGMYGRFWDSLYYGIIPQRNSYLNGVVVKVESEHDYVQLMKSERATQILNAYYPWDRMPHTYSISDVTANIKGEGLEDIPIHAVTNKRNDRKRAEATPVWHYYLYVYSHIQEWNEDFVEEFLKTGGYDRKELARVYKKFNIPKWKARGVESALAESSSSQKRRR